MSTATYEYRALDRGGAKRSGVATAGSKAEALRQLSAQGLTPISVRESRASRARGRARVRARAVAHFTSQLGVLMSARVPISDVLMTIAEQESEPGLRAVITDLAHRIEAGETLSQAMKAHVRVFGEAYVQTVRAAEVSGNLTKTLDLLSELLERQEETKRQVKGALTYPAVVMGMLVLGSTFLIGYVVPRFAAMFAQRGVELPLMTRVLKTVGESVQGYWFVYLAAIIAGLWGLRRLWRSPTGRLRIEMALHRVPIIRRILPALAISRFAHVLSLSLSAGVNLIESLDMAGRSSGRAALMRDVDRLTQAVKAGGRLTDALRRCDYLTTFTQRMLSAGEAAGELPQMCTVVAKSYDREAAHLTKTASQAIEPVLIVGIAGMVLIVALAIFLPMWNMVNLVG